MNAMPRASRRAKGRRVIWMYALNVILAAIFLIILLQLCQFIPKVSFRPSALLFLPWNLFIVMCVLWLVSIYLLSYVPGWEEVLETDWKGFISFIVMLPSFFPIPMVGMVRVGEPDRKRKRDVIPHRVRFVVPRRVYVNESVIISLEIRQTQKLEFSEYVLPTDYCQSAGTGDTYVEFHAPAFELSDGSVRVNLGSHICTKRVNWNALPKVSGKQDVLVRFYRGRSSASFYELFGTIRVNRIDHLTERQVWTLGAIAGFVAGVIPLLNVLKSLLVK